MENRTIIMLGKILLLFVLLCCLLVKQSLCIYSTEVTGNSQTAEEIEAIKADNEEYARTHPDISSKMGYIHRVSNYYIFALFAYIYIIMLTQEFVSAYIVNERIAILYYYKGVIIMREDFNENFRKNNELIETFKRLKGDPIEIITESGFKFCGIDVEADDDSVVIIDDKGRTVRIVNSHIDAVIEPQRKLDRLYKDNDCDCDDNRKGRDYD